MDRIRKALSPKSAAKEDDSSSDTEQQHKTNNKVCKTAELLLYCKGVTTGLSAFEKTFFI